MECSRYKWWLGEGILKMHWVRGKFDREYIFLISSRNDVECIYLSFKIIHILQEYLLYKEISYKIYLYSWLMFLQKCIFHNIQRTAWKNKNIEKCRLLFLSFSDELNAYVGLPTDNFLIGFAQI